MTEIAAATPQANAMTGVEVQRRVLPCERCGAAPRAKNYRLCESCVCESNAVVNAASALAWQERERTQERYRRYGFHWQNTTMSGPIPPK